MDPVQQQPEVAVAPPAAPGDAASSPAGSRAARAAVAEHQRYREISRKSAHVARPALTDAPMSASGRKIGSMLSYVEGVMTSDLPGVGAPLPRRRRASSGGGGGGGGAAWSDGSGDDDSDGCEDDGDACQVSGALRRQHWAPVALAA